MKGLNGSSKKHLPQRELCFANVKLPGADLLHASGPQAADVEFLVPGRRCRRRAPPLPSPFCVSFFLHIPSTNLLVRTANVSTAAQIQALSSQFALKGLSRLRRHAVLALPTFSYGKPASRSAAER